MTKKPQADTAPPKGKAGDEAKPAAPRPEIPPEVFLDPRSGRDRRDTRGQVNDPRRVNGERRRSNRNAA